MILGIGIDIVHLPRIARLVGSRGRDRFARRILSEQEHAEFRHLFGNASGAHEREVNYLASRWCVKEAVYKALYPRHRLVWKDVTLWKEQGKPMLLIADGGKYGIRQSHVSLSHDGHYATAMVILEN
ncbi:4'-phosphopantetheinyl transferase [Gongronella butleri]|nr:4'-phosphopantetheinyl transferase [Gongronella butleri]